MTPEPKQARSATMAIVYITIGGLIDVWTAAAYFYFGRHNLSATSNFWCAGFFFTGVVLIFIGLMVGKIGQSARQAEVTAAPPVNVVSVPTAAGPQKPVPVTNVSSVNANTPPTAPPLSTERV
jgi:hypothetical protein